MTKNPFLNAFLASSYIILVASIMFIGAQHKIGQNASILVPITFISLFTLSAATMGYIFLYQPIMFYLEGKKKEAIDLFLKTLGTFAAITILALTLLFFS